MDGAEGPEGPIASRAAASTLTDIPKPPALVLHLGSCSLPARCSGSAAKSLLFRFLPFLRWMPRYPIKDWLLGDIVSGFSVGIMHLPQGE